MPSYDINEQLCSEVMKKSYQLIAGFPDLEIGCRWRQLVDNLPNHTA